MIWRGKLYEEKIMPYKATSAKDTLLILILGSIVSFLSLLLVWYFYK